MQSHVSPCSRQASQTCIHDYHKDWIQDEDRLQYVEPRRQDADHITK